MSRPSILTEKLYKLAFINQLRNEFNFNFKRNFLNHYLCYTY